jgi:hypothetical protein
MTTFDVARRRAIALTAVGAPIASGIGVLAFHTHTQDYSRQLDLITANVPGFAVMIWSEHLTWTLLAAACCAVAVNVPGSARVLATVGALMAVGGGVASISQFGPVLPSLAALDDRGAALHVLHHLGPIYGLAMALSGFALLGALVTVCAAAWGRLIGWGYAGVLLFGLVVSQLLGDSLVQLVGAAILAVPMGRVTVALWHRAAADEPAVAAAAPHAAEAASPAARFSAAG